MFSFHDQGFFSVSHLRNPWHLTQRGVYFKIAGFINTDFYIKGKECERLSNKENSALFFVTHALPSPLHTFGVKKLLTLFKYLL